VGCEKGGDGGGGQVGECGGEERGEECAHLRYLILVNILELRLDRRSSIHNVLAQKLLRYATNHDPPLLVHRHTTSISLGRCVIIFVTVVFWVVGRAVRVATHVGAN
jgi:hypothetical protein